MKKTILFAAIAVTLVSSIWAAPKNVEDMLDKKKTITITGSVTPWDSTHRMLKDYWGKKKSSAVGLDDAFAFPVPHNYGEKSVAVVFPRSLPYARELESLTREYDEYGREKVTYVATKFLDKYCQWGWDFYYVTSVDESSAKAVVEKFKGMKEKFEKESDPEYQRQQAELKEKERLASSLAGMFFITDNEDGDWGNKAVDVARFYCETHHTGKTCPKVLSSNMQGWESHVVYNGIVTVKKNGKIEVRGRELSPEWTIDKNAVLSDLDANKQFLAFYEVEGDSIIVLVKFRSKLRYQEVILEEGYRIAELRELEEGGKQEMARRGYSYDPIVYGWNKRGIDSTMRALEF